MGSAALAEQRTSDMVRTTPGPSKPAQMVSLVRMRFLVIPCTELQRSVSIIRSPQQLLPLSPHGRLARTKMGFVVLVEQLQFDMERMTFGLPKRTQMEYPALMRFLVIQFQELQKPVRFINDFYIETQCP